ncbi:MAG: NADH-quinone oxidoreductase subunit C [Vicinamibacterales bacterium]
MDASAIIAALETLVPGTGAQAVASIDQPTIVVPAGRLREVSVALRDDPAFLFTALVDIVGVDILPSEPRFEMNYSLVAVDVPARLRIKVRAGGESPRVPSVVGVWPSAGFLEREVWDLFGVEFEGNPDMRRLLTPEDWEGHPLRKDYPVQVDTPVTFDAPTQVTEEQFRATMEKDRRLRKEGR